MAQPIYSCCSDLGLVDFSKMELLINFGDPNLWNGIVAIIIYPLYYILAAQFEHHYKWLTFLFDSPRTACFVYSLTVIPAMCWRNGRYLAAINAQPHWQFLQTNTVLWLGHAITLISLLVLLILFLQLGYMNYFLGEYFHISHPLRYSAGIFNNYPIYVASAMVMYGYAIVQASQAGVLLSIIASVMYYLVASIESAYLDRYYKRCEADKDL